MKDIREVYPDAVDIDKRSGLRFWWGAEGYNPLLESFGYKILLQVDDRDYQGDSRVLFKNRDKYGLLIFGWGSCSGCDALQACTSYEEIEELRQGLHDSIIWKNKKDMYEYIKNKDWKLDWCWHSEETREFVRRALEVLSEVTKARKICIGY